MLTCDLAVALWVGIVKRGGSAIGLWVGVLRGCDSAIAPWTGVVLRCVLVVVRVCAGFGLTVDATVAWVIDFVLWAPAQGGFGHDVGRGLAPVVRAFAIG